MYKCKYNVHGIKIGTDHTTLLSVKACIKKVK